MENLRAILGAMVLVMCCATAQAQDTSLSDPVVGVDTELLALADAGDSVAARAVSRVILERGALDERALRASLEYLNIAIAGFTAPGTANPREAGLAALDAAWVLSNLFEFDRVAETLIVANENFAQLINAPDLPTLQGIVQVSLGELYMNLADFDAALVEFRAARVRLSSQPQGEGFPITPEFTAWHVGQSWRNEGWSLGEMGLFDASMRAYNAALEQFEIAEGKDSFNYVATANGIGWTYTRLRQYDDAKAWFDYALPWIEYHEGSNSLAATAVRINLGTVAQEQGQDDEAIRWAMQAMPFMVANRQQTLDAQRWAFELLSRAFMAKGDRARAIFFGKLAVNAQQEVRKLSDGLHHASMQSMQSEWGRLYHDLADLLIAEGRISEAQAVLNMEKEEEVFDFLRRDGSAALSQTRALLSDAEIGEEARLTALAALPVAAEAELRRLTARITAGTASVAEEDSVFVLQAALEQATARFDAEVEAFILALPEPRRGSFAVQFDAVGTYQAVLAGLPRPTAIVQIAALDEATHIFLTLPGVTLHETVPVTRADLSRAVFEALQAIEARDPAVNAPLAALYDQVFAPIRPALDEAGIDVVMLNLEGFLRYVPFAALHDGSGYLAERFAFALYSPAVPTQFVRGASAQAVAAGFGVTAAHPGFSPLPGVKAEIEGLFGAVGGAAGVLVGTAALDAEFNARGLKVALLKKPAVLHIASHFSLRPGQEDDSFLLLGDGAHLRLSDIRSQRAYRFQGVDLLTLSACQTARGGDGAEIEGFGATAQLNGAAAVLASLWPVADDATPVLMRDFYAGFLAGGLDKAEALRRAQVAMLQGAAFTPDRAAGPGVDRAAVSLTGDVAQAPVGLAHPYYWSAFVLMGNWL